MSKILDGKAVAEKIASEVAENVRKLARSNITPKLVIVVGTNNKSTLSYVGRLVKKADELGIKAEISQIENPSNKAYEDTLNKLSNDSNVHGIILQTPLPNGVDLEVISQFVPAEKDVDGINPNSSGKLLAGQKAFAPATAEAVIKMLEHYEIEIEGKNAVVLGRSMIVGKPAAILLSNLNATVTICHSRTNKLASLASSADILVSAIGKVKFITDEFVNENTTVIDVGTNFDENGKMVGDVDFDLVSEKVSAISPVPGGVGPITTILLLKHTCEAALRTL